eukprot:TRINITY_DN83372_c0_g1_i1.p1 TRINITY_DN83372_c0_g1~~TRINITY_DN83372_c0_g1_i1.p1  ORF type:complete len:122 (+),score=7.46 TRINITY_DN83372_c0_g1_i1:38-367(+)
MIRKALRRQDGHFGSVLDPPAKLPGFCELSRCRYRMMTNWASFMKPIMLEGCEQSLHLPHVGKQYPTDMLYLFRPTPTTLGALVITRQLDDTTLTGVDSYFDKVILPPS